MSPTTPEEHEERVSIGQIARHKAPDFKSVYANNAGSAATFHEVRLIFGQILAGPDEPETVLEHSVSVSMTWEHAAQLRDLLTRLIGGYEKDHGPIRKQRDPGPKQDSKLLPPDKT